MRICQPGRRGSLENLSVPTDTFHLPEVQHRFVGMWQVEGMKVFRPRERSLLDALTLSEVVLSLAQTQMTPHLAVSVVQGPAVILGAMQRTGRVVDARACAQAGVPLLRRVTTGTAAWMGGAGIVMALALPHVATIKEDATEATLLNRNVRPFLRAFSQAGAMAHYFGREWISIRKQPGALLGFDVTREGGVLVEVIAGFDQAIGLPAELMTDDERAVDRFMGKTPLSLRHVFPDARIATLPERLVEAFVADVARPTTSETLEPARSSSWVELTDEMDPWPGGYGPHSLVRVPIGYLDVGVFPTPCGPTPCLGGDVLAPRWLYSAVTQQMSESTYPDFAPVPMVGATIEDLVNAVKV
jgi:hypothetical protein